MQLTKNFRVSEFLRSKVYPPLRDYQPSGRELRNLRLLTTKILQPVRDVFGRVNITGGGRPPIVDWYTLLRSKGYDAAKNSDHNDFSGVDFSLGSQSLNEKAFNWLTDNPVVGPWVRQVILYPSHIHVAVVTPEKSKIRGKNHAFKKGSLT